MHPRESSHSHYESKHRSNRKESSRTEERRSGSGSSDSWSPLRDEEKEKENRKPKSSRHKSKRYSGGKRETERSGSGSSADSPPWSPLKEIREAQVGSEAQAEHTEYTDVLRHPLTVTDWPDTSLVGVGLAQSAEGHTGGMEQFNTYPELSTPGFLDVRDITNVINEVGERPTVLPQFTYEPTNYANYAPLAAQEQSQQGFLQPQGDTYAQFPDYGTAPMARTASERSYASRSDRGYQQRENPYNIYKVPLENLRPGVDSGLRPGDYEFVRVNANDDHVLARRVGMNADKGHLSLVGGGTGLHADGTPVEIRYGGRFKINDEKGKKGTLKVWDNHTGHFESHTSDEEGAGLPSTLFDSRGSQLKREAEAMERFRQQEVLKAQYLRGFIDSNTLEDISLSSQSKGNRRKAATREATRVWQEIKNNNNPYDHKKTEIEQAVYDRANEIRAQLISDGRIRE